MRELSDDEKVLLEDIDASIEKALRVYEVSKKPQDARHLAWLMKEKDEQLQQGGGTC